ncbi:hypothetical protein ACSBR1_002577 [Camellia fascicularis]
MQNTSYKSNSIPRPTLPPRRGQIKLRILGKFIKSVASIGGGGVGRGKGENGESLSPISTTPLETPSGYNSDG